MKPAHLQCSSSNGLVSVDQFEAVVREYKKLNNETGQTEEKTTKFMEQVSTQVIYKDLNKKLCNLQKSYCSHKFLVYDNIYHWPRILATVPEYGPILQMDFSKNLSQMHKYEPQSAHFNKRNYPLHCAVEHMDH